jgi:hypothetical protein
MRDGDPNRRREFRLREVRAPRDLSGDWKPALPPDQLPIRHPVRLIRIRALPLLQIFYISLKIPLEPRARKRGYDGIGVRLIGEMAGGRVVHPCHGPTFVTSPLVTDLASRRVAAIWPAVKRVSPAGPVRSELRYDIGDQLGFSVMRAMALVQLAVNWVLSLGRAPPALSHRPQVRRRRASVPPDLCRSPSVERTRPVPSDAGRSDLPAFRTSGLSYSRGEPPPAEPPPCGCT